jgi:hypothetical protein
MSVIPAAAAQERVTEMLTMGFEAAAIADAAGITRGTVKVIAVGGKELIQQRTADAVLALDPNQPIPHHRVPNVIVTRMLTEMRARGLTLQLIYKMAGVSPKFKGNYAGMRVEWRNYAKLQYLHERLSDSGLLEEVGDGASTQPYSQG